jgi:hypothetical protein
MTGDGAETGQGEPPAIGHPRPLLRRREWVSLDGPWDFLLDDEGCWTHPGDVPWEQSGPIRVPFAPETEASGVHDTGYHRRCWYRRRFVPPPAHPDERVVVHFGAVDHLATVWVDGRLVTRHEGGYSPFEVDISREVRDPGDHEIVVRADDDPMDLAKPRGKQDWELEPHSIWYPRTTGIWQSVWLEVLPSTAICGVQWATDLDRVEVDLEVAFDGPIEGGMHLGVHLHVGDRVLVDDLVAVAGSPVARGFRLDGTGIEQLRDALAWRPENPVLVDAHLQLRRADGTVVDDVYSYTALRTVGVRAGRLLLNNRPYTLRLVLDQGYWPDSGLTPPDDDALRRDVELVKAMGFNGVRKHQKIEDPRFLHWADRLGLLVWYECPPAYRYDTVAVRRLTSEWTAAVERDRSHPCIVAWVPFNESTGVLQLAGRADQRSFVQALALLTHALDPTRPVVANDGWEALGGDMIGVHDYEQDPEKLLAHWRGDLTGSLAAYAAHGRLPTLDETAASLAPRGRPGRPVVLTEFGGIGWRPEAPVEHEDDRPPDAADDRMAQPSAWGYSTVWSAHELADRIDGLFHAVHAADALAGYCYTQFADTYQEVNGLVYADRTPKVPLERIAAANRGPARGYHDPMA